MGLPRNILLELSGGAPHRPARPQRIDFLYSPLRAMLDTKREGGPLRALLWSVGVVRRKGSQLEAAGAADAVVAGKSGFGALR